MLIRTSDKEILQNIFAEYLTIPAEVWIYGSRINGTAHAASDIDLVIRTSNLAPVNPGQFMLLRDKIRESNIPVLVELRDLAALPKSFHEQIEKEYEVLFRSS